MLTITRDQAKTFILIKQGLLGKHRFIGKQGAYRYVCEAGCIQYDPVDVCGRNAELTLLSRVRGFKRETLSELLYRDRLLVDYPDKELSIWPAKDWPYFESYRQRSREHAKNFPELEALKTRAETYIRKNGPVSSDTLPIEGDIFWHSAMHWSGNWAGRSPAARSVLEQMYTDGTLLIHHKAGTRKSYDLAERYLSPEALSSPCPCPDEKSFRQWRIARRIGAVGLLWDRRSDAFLGIRMTPGERSEAFAALTEAGVIVPVGVEGLRAPLYMLRRDEGMLESVLGGAADRKARLEFLAPLDPMLWDRKLVEALWDYQYSWEIYTPREKRRYGHYVLPMLYGENFAGRIEAAAERKRGALNVKNIWFEPGTKRGKRMDAAIGKALSRLAAFNGCAEIIGDFGDGPVREE